MSRNTKPQLEEVDLARLRYYLDQPQRQVARRPFRFWRLLLILLAVMTSCSVLSYLLAYFYGLV